MIIKVFPDEKILAKNLALEILKELKKKKRLHYSFKYNS